MGSTQCPVLFAFIADPQKPYTSGGCGRREHVAFFQGNTANEQHLRPNGYSMDILPGGGHNTCLYISKRNIFLLSFFGSAGCAFYRFFGTSVCYVFSFGSFYPFRMDGSHAGICPCQNWKLMEKTIALCLLLCSD